MKVVFSLFLLLTVFASQAQRGVVRGFIYDETTGEPVPFANVMLKDAIDVWGSTSDYDGMYVIQKIPVGEYIMSIQAIQYEKLHFNLDIDSATQIITKNYVLKPEEVLYEPPRPYDPYKEEVKVSVVKITQEDIAKLPGRAPTSNLIGTVAIDGQPAAGVKITVTGPGDQLSITHTQHDGTYRIRVYGSTGKKTHYHIVALSQDGRSKKKTVRLTLEDTGRLDFKF